MTHKLRILVTGANGFIASLLTASLKETGAYIKGLDISQGPYANCDESIQCDLTVPLEENDVLRKACEDIDVVYHLAGKVHSLSEVKSDKEEYWRINVQGSNNLLSAAKQKHVRKCIFFSAVNVFGERQDNKTGKPITEQDQPSPDTPYGETKYEVEKTLLNETSIDTVILRLSMVYGPHAKGNLTKMIHAVQSGIPIPLPDFGNKRSMVDVHDVVRAAVLASQNDTMHGVYQVTDGNVYSTSQIINYIYEALGKKRPFLVLPKFVFILFARIGDLIGIVLRHRFFFDSDALNKLVGNAYYSSDRLKNELHFVPEWDLRKSLLNTYKK